MTWLADTQTSYDTVAVDYAALVRGAITKDQYLRTALAMFAESVQAAGGGPVVDVGCGPGEVTAHLHALGLEAFGVDLSPGMVDVAGRAHPGVRFEVGSMTDLALPAASVTGLIAWQSLIHIPDDEVKVVLNHFHRVLRPGGPLQLLFHVGDSTRLKTEGYGGHPMKVHIHRRQPDQVSDWLRDSGFKVEAYTMLDPGEKPQAFVFARRED
ncbi:class I SAM-dependent methyltransferase [Kibdelosporangium phytohabitans]|uniref:Methyltransferase n=1 Tax=Kibdelosporangium phytohabitans TaxID=860235 RepID=A0A0N9I459_9PSEU|nr:class I SAM-dependent methyltransferase [Kibdelosporangium phytohabitans]ALG09357.1 methyltransferase [Kibdelosporangium phytohabitans]MBE1469377.1 ubiquinone/menaquinone biosynthesis C-methylase UbiE [Kibdelosporangium phytohabitans]